MKSAVRRKKVMYRRLLDLGTEEARKKYNEATTGAKRLVRRAKNEEWVQLRRTRVRKEYDWQSIEILG